MKNQFEGVIGGRNYETVLAEISPFYGELLTLMSKKIATVITGENTVLCDLGCGTGKSTKALVENCPSATIIAVDASRNMLDAAPEELRLNPRINWVHSDMLSLLRSLPDRSVDGFANGYAVHNLTPDVRRSLFSLIGAKIKKGGIFVSADKIAVNDEAHHKQLFEERLEEYRRLKTVGFRKESEEWLQHYASDDVHRLTEAELKKGLLENGFTSVDFSARNGMYAIAEAK